MNVRFTRGFQHDPIHVVHLVYGSSEKYLRPIDGILRKVIADQRLRAVLMHDKTVPGNVLRQWRLAHPSCEFIDMEDIIPVSSTPSRKIWRYYTLCNKAWSRVVVLDVDGGELDDLLNPACFAEFSDTSGPNFTFLPPFWDLHATQETMPSAMAAGFYSHAGFWLEDGWASINAVAKETLARHPDATENNVDEYMADVLLYALFGTGIHVKPGSNHKNYSTRLQKTGVHISKTPKNAALFKVYHSEDDFLDTVAPWLSSVPHRDYERVASSDVNFRDGLTAIFVFGPVTSETKLTLVERRVRGKTTNINMEQGTCIVYNTDWVAAKEQQEWRDAVKVINMTRKTQ